MATHETRVTTNRGAVAALSLGVNHSLLYTSLQAERIADVARLKAGALLRDRVPAQITAEPWQRLAVGASQRISRVCYVLKPRSGDSSSIAVVASRLRLLNRFQSVGSRRRLIAAAVPRLKIPRLVYNNEGEPTSDSEAGVTPG